MAKSMDPRHLVAALLALVCLAASAGAQAPTPELRAVVSPLPTDLRAGAGIYLERDDGGFEQVRASTNGMSCARRRLERPDGTPILDVRCYSDLMWPAIFYRWSVESEHDGYDEVYADVARQAELGRFELPATPTAGYRILGLLADFDMETGEPGPRMNKWQSIHTPFRTAEELGISEAEEANRDGEPGVMPYVMASGTWWSHVMIEHGTVQPSDDETAPTPPAQPATDTALAHRHAAVAEAGQMVMPFDLARTTHVFETLDDGGLQTVVSDDGDAEQVRLVREHLAEEAERFARGDFHDPAMIHGHDMAGLHELMMGAERIEITYAEVESGATIRYRTDDPALVDAIHRWFEAQLRDHGAHARPGGGG